MTLSSDGSGRSVAGVAFDNAGTSPSAIVDNITIDQTPPSISLDGGPADGGTCYFGYVPTAALRHDLGQFFSNWKTPKQSGKCYRVTLTTQDGMYTTADFRLT